MKRNILNRLYFFVLVVSAVAFAACNEDLKYEKENNDPPVIESFSPMTATIGSDITITGKHLQKVDEVLIGGTEVPIKTRVSNTTLIITASEEARSGKITVKNKIGSYVSQGTFTYLYRGPDVRLDELPASTEMGGNLLISGLYMNVVQKVIFNSNNVKSEAEILTHTPTEVIVKVPYVAGDDAQLSFTYFDGTDFEETSLEGAPAIQVIRNAPVISTTSYPQTNAGKSITVQGVYLNKVDSITVGGFRAQINAQSNSSITFSVPLGDFPDGLTSGLEIISHYFDGNETQVLTTNFDLYVPFVLLWEDVYLGSTEWSLYKDGFFSPETGLKYLNTSWATELDPVANNYKMTQGSQTTPFSNGVAQGLTCSGPNKPAISEAEYNSVVPYFYMTSMSSFRLALSSPANSVAQLRNYRTGTSGADRVCGQNDCTGTPVVMFRMLQETNADELPVINQVRNEQLTVIDQTTFPIDIANGKVGPIDIKTTGRTMSGALNQDSSWAVPYTEGATDQAIDPVLLVVYYNVNGYDVNNPTANIVKIGFMNIKRVTLAQGSSAGAPGASNISFNMYWQKYAY